jgi:hypothetical protein
VGALTILGGRLTKNEETYGNEEEGSDFKIDAFSLCTQYIGKVYTPRDG